MGCLVHSHHARQREARIRPLHPAGCSALSRHVRQTEAPTRPQRQAGCSARSLLHAQRQRKKQTHPPRPVGCSARSLRGQRRAALAHPLLPQPRLLRGQRRRWRAAAGAFSEGSLPLQRLPPAACLARSPPQRTTDLKARRLRKRARPAACLVRRQPLLRQRSVACLAAVTPLEGLDSAPSVLQAVCFVAAATLALLQLSVEHTDSMRRAGVHPKPWPSSRGLAVVRFVLFSIAPMTLVTHAMHNDVITLAQGLLNHFAARL
mmetsp:Transcript_3145/g.7450  ORF Transcript_3145/g.7450 Transcript_3145/m.7450 type:complete len:262 (-) Transcript_3145:192-977(-)